MASVKIILRAEQKQDGTYPLAIRITKNRKSSYIYLEYAVREDQWDKDAQRVKRSHANHVRLNNYLLKKLSEANDKALEIETQKEHVSSRAVSLKIKPKGGMTFFAQGQLFLDTLKASGKYNQYTSDKARIKHFKEFLKGDDIAFTDVSVGMLERFVAYLKGHQKVSERTAANHLVTVRSVFSQAIKNEIVDARYYPFGKGKMKIKFPESIKIGLTEEEIKRLEAADLPEPFHNHCRNLFLFSFYFAGMRVSDVLRMRFSDFRDSRLHYAMGKNNKGGSLKTPEKAEAIIAHYEQFKVNKDDLIFPELKRLETLDDKFTTQKAIAFAVSRIDKCLRTHVAPKAEIDKHLTMHIARHTFGNISGERIPVQMLQKLYRHSSITTTIGYQANFIHRDADAALDAVLKF